MARLTNSDRDGGNVPADSTVYSNLPEREWRWLLPIVVISSRGAGGNGRAGAGRGGGNVDIRGPAGVRRLFPKGLPLWNFGILVLPVDDSILLMLGTSEFDMVEIRLFTKLGRPMLKLGTVEELLAGRSDPECS